MSRNYLGEVELAIANRPASDKKTYYLCEFRGKIFCLPQAGITETYHKFQKIMEFECVEGLTSNGWNRLDEKIRAYFAK